MAQLEEEEGIEEGITTMGDQSDKEAEELPDLDTWLHDNRLDELKVCNILAH